MGPFLAQHYPRMSGDAQTRIDTWGLCGDRPGFLFSARYAEDRRHGATSENRKQSLTQRSAIPSVGVNGHGP